MEERLERVLPNNLDAEKSVLGSMLLEKDALELVLEQLRVEDFYSAAHQRIFEAMANIRQAGQAVDLVTLSEELERRGFLDMVGGADVDHGLEDVLMGDAVEILRPELLQDQLHGFLLQEHASQHGLLRIQIVGQDPFQSLFHFISVPRR